MKLFLASIALMIITISAVYPAGNSEEYMRAMRHEIERSMKELKLEGLRRPYYIEYTLTITNENVIKATLGSLEESNYNHVAQLSVGVRVGDYKFDNSNYFDFGFSFFGSGDDEERFTNRTIPSELDYRILRRELWLATDAAYKQTAELLSKKEATTKNRVRKDTTYDFMQLEPDKLYDTIPHPKFDKAKYEKLLRDVSMVFRNYPKISISSAGIEYMPKTVYYVNSEGREYIRTDLYSGLEIVALAQAEDGMPLTNIYSAYSLDPNDLPGRDSLLKAADNTAKKLVDLSSKSSLDEPYSGPILFEGQAAAELFAQTFAGNLVSQREPLTEAGIQEPGRFALFQNKIGGRVLPEFISVSDVPKLEIKFGTKLSGHYNIDDDGVKSDKVELVKDGYLKALLSDRTPTRRVRNTNGHKRGGAPMFSNLILETDIEHSKDSDELKKRMMELCAARELPYGIIVRKAINQNIMFTTLFRLSYGSFPVARGVGKMGLIEIYKLFPDGKEELIRGAETGGFTVQSFKDILLTGKKHYVLNLLAPAVVSPFISGGSSYVSSSVIVPDLLFEDGEIKPIEADYPKPPIVPNPLSKK